VRKSIQPGRRSGRLLFGEVETMSMIGNLRRLRDADLARLLTSPELIGDYLHGDPPELEEAEEDAQGFGPYADIDIDKAWHGLHFLLTGDAWGGSFPWSFLIDGGTQVGDVDVGYGPARGFRSSEVKQIADALNSVDPAALAGRFDPEKMARAEVYPGIWDREEDEAENLQYLMNAFEAVRDFITGAAEVDEALLIHLN
jgi:hypothetical protein